MAHKTDKISHKMLNLKIERIIQSKKGITIIFSIVFPVAFLKLNSFFNSFNVIAF